MPRNLKRERHVRDSRARRAVHARARQGKLLGLTLTLTPGNAESTLLQLLNTLTPLVPITMTDVTADQPVVLSDSGAISGLTVTAS